MTDHERQSVSAAVLAGGRSSRMGHDKALIEVQGKSILERVLRSLSEVTAQVLIVGDREAYRGYGVPVLSDAVSGAGPLGGIYTALVNSPSEYMFIVGCDMPFLSSSLLQAMAFEPREIDALVPCLDDHSGRSGVQPLHALYSTRCVDSIMARLKRDELKVQLFLDDVNTRFLDSRWLRQFDPDLRSFMNVNTPDDVCRVSKLLEEENSEGTDR